MNKCEWEARLIYELSHVKACGGTAVFLTLTYNWFSLPLLEYDALITYDAFGNQKRYEPMPMPIFDNEDIKKLTDSLNSFMQFKYGKKSYKYFVAGEYGKNTKRPHYHLLLMFYRSDISWKQVTEKVRELWQDNGFLFPRYRKDIDMYVDNFGKCSTPLLKGFDPASGVPLIAGARYVSKYVCKDLSFLQLPHVVDLVERSYTKNNRKYILADVGGEFHKYLLRRFLPIHLQSKGLGYSILDCIDFSDAQSVHDALTIGVRNPLDPSDVIALPQYALRKLLFKYIRSRRVSPVTGLNLYDRYLTDFGKAYLSTVFQNNVTRLSSNFKKYVEQSKTLPTTVDIYKKVCQFINDKPHYISDVFVAVSCYRLHLRYLCGSALRQLFIDFNGDISLLFCPHMIAPYYVLSRDTDSLKRLPYSEPYPSDLMRDTFEYLKELNSLFNILACRIKSEHYRLVTYKRDESDRYRFIHSYKYDKNLC